MGLSTAGIVSKARNLREDVVDKIAQWNNLNHYEANRELSRIAKYKGSNGLTIFNHDEANKILPILEKLNGPHGYAIYKALVAKRDAVVGAN